MSPLPPLMPPFMMLPDAARLRCLRCHAAYAPIFFDAAMPRVILPFACHRFLFDDYNAVYAAYSFRFMVFSLIVTIFFFHFRYFMLSFFSFLRH